MTTDPIYLAFRDGVTFAWASGADAPAARRPLAEVQPMRVWVPLILVLLMAGAANAQSAAQDPRPAPRPSPDFLFGRPDGTIGIRGSWVAGRNGSDWYDFVTDQLTIEPKDFNAPGFGTDLGITLTDRVDSDDRLRLQSVDDAL